MTHEHHYDPRALPRVPASATLTAALRGAHQGLRAWTGTGDTAGAALVLADGNTVTAVAFRPYATAPGDLALASAFGARVRALRAERDLKWCPVISACRPRPRADRVLVAHLVTLSGTRTGADVTDAIVWEHIPHAHAGRWLGRSSFPYEDAAYFATDTALDALTQARRMARRGTLKRTGPAGAEASALVKDHYLSMLLVLRHAKVFRHLTRELRAAVPRTASAFPAPTPSRPGAAS